MQNQLHDYIKSIVGEPILIPDGAVESEELDEMIMRGIAPNQIINYKTSSVHRRACGITASRPRSSTK